MFWIGDSKMDKPNLVLFVILISVLLVPLGIAFLVPNQTVLISEADSNIAASNLNDLNDVDVVTVQDGNVLVYDAASYSWVPGVAIGGGGNGDVNGGSNKDPFFNGTFAETFNAITTSDGATVTMSLEQSGGGDLTMQFSDGNTVLDCTPACTIVLTAVVILLRLKTLFMFHKQQKS